MRGFKHLTAMFLDVCGAFLRKLSIEDVLVCICVMFLLFLRVLMGSTTGSNISGGTRGFRNVSEPF